MWRIGIRNFVSIRTDSDFPYRFTMKDEIPPNPNERNPEEESVDNPIDPDKVTDTPGLLPYPHHIGSPAFAPTESGAIKHRGFRAMEEQSQRELQRLREQMAVVARQADDLKRRMEVSKAVYGAEMNFEPVIGKVYHLYARAENFFVLSMIAPDEWNKQPAFKHFVASVRLLADHTWEVVEQADL